MIFSFFRVNVSCLNISDHKTSRNESESLSVVGIATVPFPLEMGFDEGTVYIISPVLLYLLYLFIHVLIYLSVLLLEWGFLYVKCLNIAIQLRLSLCSYL